MDFGIDFHQTMTVLFDVLPKLDLVIRCILSDFLFGINLYKMIFINLLAFPAAAPNHFFVVEFTGGYLHQLIEVYNFNNNNSYITLY